jgi:VanZ family protein
MDIKEKRILISLISSVLIMFFYVLYVYNRQIAGNPDILNDFRFWGKSFLILIPVGIVAQIIIQIGFAIFMSATSKEEIDPIEDERDKLIELKAIKISHYLFLIGFMLAMGSLALGMKPWVMFVVLISSGFIASIVNEIARLYFYRKGV